MLSADSCTPFPSRSRNTPESASHSRALAREYFLGPERVRRDPWDAPRVPQSKGAVHWVLQQHGVGVVGVDVHGAATHVLGHDATYTTTCDPP